MLIRLALSLSIAFFIRTAAALDAATPHLALPHVDVNSVHDPLLHRLLATHDALVSHRPAPFLTSQGEVKTLHNGALVESKKERGFDMTPTPLSDKPDMLAYVDALRAYVDSLSTVRRQEFIRAYMQHADADETYALQRAMDVKTVRHVQNDDRHPRQTLVYDTTEHPEKQTGHSTSTHDSTTKDFEQLANLIDAMTVGQLSDVMPPFIAHADDNTMDALHRATLHTLTPNTSSNDEQQKSKSVESVSKVKRSTSAVDDVTMQRRSQDTNTGSAVRHRGRPGIQADVPPRPRPISPQPEPRPPSPPAPGSPTRAPREQIMRMHRRSQDANTNNSRGHGLPRPGTREAVPPRFPEPRKPQSRPPSPITPRSPSPSTPRSSTHEKKGDGTTTMQRRSSPDPYTGIVIRNRPRPGSPSDVPPRPRPDSPPEPRPPGTPVPGSPTREVKDAGAPHRGERMYRRSQDADADGSRDRPQPLTGAQRPLLPPGYEPKVKTQPPSPATSRSSSPSSPRSSSRVKKDDGSTTLQRRSSQNQDVDVKQSPPRYRSDAKDSSSPRSRSEPPKYRSNLPSPPRSSSPAPKNRPKLPSSQRPGSASIGGARNGSRVQRRGQDDSGLLVKRAPMSVMRPLRAVDDVTPALHKRAPMSALHHQVCHGKVTTAIICDRSATAESSPYVKRDPRLLKKREAMAVGHELRVVNDLPQVLHKRAPFSAKLYNCHGKLSTGNICKRSSTTMGNSSLVKRAQDQQVVKSDIMPIRKPASTTSTLEANELAGLFTPTQAGGYSNESRDKTVSELASEAQQPLLKSAPHLLYKHTLPVVEENVDILVFKRTPDTTPIAVRSDCCACHQPIDKAKKYLDAMSGTLEKRNLGCEQCANACVTSSKKDSESNNNALKKRFPLLVSTLTLPTVQTQQGPLMQNGDQATTADQGAVQEDHVSAPSNRVIYRDDDAPLIKRAPTHYLMPFVPRRPA